jgi:hypothetical protein
LFFFCGLHFLASNLETPESKEIKQADAEEEATVTKEIEQLHEKATKEKSRNIPRKPDGSRLRLSTSSSSKLRRNDEIFPFEKPKPLAPAFQMEQSNFTTIKRREIVNEEDLVNSNVTAASVNALMSYPLKRKSEEPDREDKRPKIGDSFSSSTRFTGVSRPIVDELVRKDKRPKIGDSNSSSARSTGVSRPMVERQSSIDSIDNDRGRGGTIRQEKRKCPYCRELKKKGNCANKNHRDGYLLDSKPLDSGYSNNNNYSPRGGQRQPPAPVVSTTLSQAPLQLRPVMAGGSSPYVSASTSTSTSFSALPAANSRCPSCLTQKKTCSDPKHVEGVPYPAPASLISRTSSAPTSLMSRTPSIDLNDETPVDEEISKKVQLREEYEKRKYIQHHQERIQYVLPTAAPHGPPIAGSSSSTSYIVRTSSSDSQRGSSSGLSLLPLGKHYKTPLERLKESSMSKPVSAFREEPKRYEPSDKNAKPTKSVLRTTSAYKELDGVGGSGINNSRNVKSNDKKITFVEDAKLTEVIRFEPIPPFPMYYPNENNSDIHEKVEME